MDIDITVPNCVNIYSLHVISTKYLSVCLFCLWLLAYLLLNAASYDGEILKADAYRPCAGHGAGFYVRGRDYENNDIFPIFSPTFLLPILPGWLAAC